MQYICGCDIGKYIDKTKNRSCYNIRLGVFKNYNSAIDFQIALWYQGLKTDIIRMENLFVVQSEDITGMEEAVICEYCLRHAGFDTILLT